MTYTAAEHDSGPIAVRYPRGSGTGVALPETPQLLAIGKGRIVREGKKVAIMSLGTRLAEAIKAADVLDAKGLSTTVADLRFAKRSEEHTSELRSLMRISYAVFCLKKKTNIKEIIDTRYQIRNIYS